MAKSSIYDMAVDAQEKYFLISGQDKFIRFEKLKATCEFSSEDRGARFFLLLMFV